MTPFRSLTLLAALALAASFSHAQTVDIRDAWVRATVPGQKATGGFMKLTSPQALTLVGVSSPVAGAAEIHEMKMENDIMRMRALPAGLPLPAGQTVELKPGGLHLMLLDLKAPVAKDATVPLTLRFRDAAGKTLTQTVKVPTGLAPAAGGAPASGGHSHH